MIPRFKPDIRLLDLLALIPSFRRHDTISSFETAFATLASQQEAIAFPYGRTALFMMLKALRLHEAGATEVICPSYTCVVVAHAISLSGHTPVFVDCAAPDYNMDWDEVERATNVKTGAVIVTSIFGNPVSLQKLEAYRAQHPNIHILQDCAHSFMASAADGKRINQVGKAAFYGLNISKLITSVFGGMVTTDDAAFAQALRALRARDITRASARKNLLRSLYLIAAYIAFLQPVYGVVNWLERKGFLARFARYYDPAKIDLPVDAFEGLSAVEARVGRLQCSRYESIIAHRRKIARLYFEGLKDVDGLVLPADVSGATWPHFVIHTTKAADIIDGCLSRGIQLGELIDYDIIDMPAYQHAAYYGEHRARAFVHNVINLPVHVGVSENNARQIVSVVRGLYFSAVSNDHKRQ